MILFVNACVRKDSRTKRLADHLLARIGEQGEEPIEEVKLSEISFPTDRCGGI